MTRRMTAAVGCALVFAVVSPPASVSAAQNDRTARAGSTAKSPGAAAKTPDAAAKSPGDAAKTPGAAAKKGWTPPKTAWGDPLIQGVYTNNDESGIPLERPDQFSGKTLAEVDNEELAELIKQRQEQNIERLPSSMGDLGLTSPLHWFENYEAKNSRAWLVVDPPDGTVPPVTAEGQRRAAARAAARAGRGPADSWEDRSLYDRCITRGIPGSMMPAIYGNAYQIVQGPGYVAILYEMIHEARVIPLDGQPHPNEKIRMYMGDARGHFDGDTLVVETTNFTDKTSYRGSSEYLTMTERFKPIAPNTVEWSVTFDDPHTWTRPWAFAMNLTKKDDTQRPFEYGCHEGNYGLRDILSAARAEEKAGRTSGAGETLER